MAANRFVEWTHNGGTRFCHSSQLSAPLWSAHGQRWAAPMTIRKFFVIAFASAVLALGGCEATHRDTSGDPPYKDRIGQVCEVLMPIRAHGYTFTLERDKKTDAISIWNPGFTGPEVTFVLPLQPGTTLTILEARECTNCPFDRNPEYRVHVSPEPPQFEGKPSYLRATSLTKELLRCTGGKNAAQPGSQEGLRE